MATLAEKNSDITVLKIDINEPDSSVARQYKIEQIPYFEIYDGKGRQIAEGEKAVRWLDKAMKEANLSD